jgi:hypothetical protein
MKFLMIALAVVAAVIGGLAVGCGPSKHYCPDNSTGQCLDASTMMEPPPDGGGLGGDATIISGDDAS